MNDTLARPRTVPASEYGPIARGLAGTVASTSRPLSARAHLVGGAAGTRLFVPDGSRYLALDPETEVRLSRALAMGDDEGVQHELAILGLDTPPAIDDTPLQSPPLHAISLAIAQKCNMGCTYCYADQGDFGGPAKNMPLDTALQAIDVLMQGKQPGDRVQIAFMGGEPLVNRPAIREATRYARLKADDMGLQAGFSITTNGTLLTEDDAVFFEKYGFAVTLSLDGLQEAHDAQRPMKGGQGSYDRIMQKIRPLLAMQKNMQVSARVTVTPANIHLAEALDEFIEMGFHSVGLSPLLRSPNGQNEMSQENLEKLLTAMITCGLRFENAVLQGRRYPFLNMVNALKEIGKATHRPYPCGAGAGYMGVSAEGELSACHRFVNDTDGQMGNLTDGPDADRQNTWLADRHVHQQSPCTQCWARYLCGGGCHHEVIDKGRTACNYIRGWLHYALQAHDRLERLAPGWNR
ncbi:MAG: radical SAM protein [Cyclobacteriaceae bacterium]